MKKLLQLAAPYRFVIILAILLGAGTIGSSIGLMATAAYIIASAAWHPSIADLAVPIVGVRFFGIARGVFRYLERYASHSINLNLLARLRVWFYQSIEPLAPARLIRYRSGDLLTRIVSDIETLQNFYVRLIAPPIVALVVAIATGIGLAGFDASLTLIVLTFTIIIGIAIPMVVQRVSGSTNRQLIEQRAELNAQLVDSIQGIADVIAFGRADTQMQSIQQSNHAWMRLQTRMATIAGAHNALGNLLAHLAMWCALLVAIPLVNSSQIDGVYLPVIALAVLASFEGALALPSAFQYLEGNRQSARRLFEIVDTSPNIILSEAKNLAAPIAFTPLLEEHDALPTPSVTKAVFRPPSAISFRNISFRYAPGEPLALDNVSFDVPAGTSLAVVGASGAGKSTIANLLLRFWDYADGSIMLGDRELSEYSQEQAREFFSVVAQPPHLFNDTIRENLLLARSNATDAEIIDAARRAQIHDVIATLPAQYDTRIGEQGLRLSGGERQRLAIARALLKRAAILMLDEATANLDPVTESAVLHELATLARKRTRIMITHRLVGLDNIDQIIVLRAGRIAERGTHQELLARNGIYRRMYDLQNQILH